MLAAMRDVPIDLIDADSALFLGESVGLDFRNAPGSGGLCGRHAARQAMSRESPLDGQTRPIQAGPPDLGDARWDEAYDRLVDAWRLTEISLRRVGRRSAFTAQHIR